MAFVRKQTAAPKVRDLNEKIARVHGEAMEAIEEAPHSAEGLAA